MIRLDLGPEPADLATARAAGIARVLALPAAPASADITGYRAPVYAALHQRQRAKCAWCERPIGRTGEPVEHVRPKGGASDAAGQRAPTHYWWLAWTWENLVFSCASCNSAGNKGNRYPLRPGTARLPEPTAPVAPGWFDVSAEAPLLIHPRREDPLDLLAWRVVDRRLPRRRWRWTLRGRDRAQRGDHSIKILGLAAVEDSVNAHLQGLLLLDQQLRSHLVAARPAEAAALWAELVDTYVDAPSASFRAAAWWALEALWPEPDRRAHGLFAPSRPQVRWP